MPRKYTNRVLEIIARGGFDPVEIATMALSALSEDEVEEMCRANDIVDAMFPEDEDSSGSVKDAYPDGVCPDCGEDIPDDVEDGEVCVNCGHTFTHERDAD